jgi:hypothetical protein
LVLEAVKKPRRSNPNNGAPEVTQMHEPRKLLSWILAFTSLVCVQISVSSILRQHTGGGHFSLTYWPFLSMLPWILLPFTLGLALAWWAFFNAEFLFSIWGSILSWWHAAEIRRKRLNRFDLEKLGTISAKSPRAIPGDGTSDLLNLVIPLLLSFAPILAFYWWSECNPNSETSPCRLSSSCCLSLSSLFTSWGIPLSD